MRVRCRSPVDEVQRLGCVGRLGVEMLHRTGLAMVTKQSLEALEPFLDLTDPFVVISGRSGRLQDRDGAVDFPR